MTRIAAYVVLILLAFMFATSTALWQVPVRTDGGGFDGIVDLLESPDPRYPSEPTVFDAGYRVDGTACSGCHGVATGYYSEPNPVSPRNIYEHITWGHSISIENDSDSYGFDSGKNHPAFPVALSDSDRWAVSNWLTSIQLLPILDFGDNTGAELFSAYCTDCHGPMGYGNGPLAGDLTPPPSNLRDTGWLAGKSNLDLYNAIASGEGLSETTGMPSWSHVLTHEEIMILVAYVRYFGVSMVSEPDWSHWPEVDGPDSNEWSWREIQNEFSLTSDVPPDFMN